MYFSNSSVLLIEVWLLFGAMLIQAIGQDIHLIGHLGNPEVEIV